jgi:hypothetical protein
MKACGKTVLRIALALLISVALFIALHVAATAARGYEAIGGEAAILFTPLLWSAAREQRKR